MERRQMNDYQKIKNANQGELITLHRGFDNFPDPVSYFAKLTNYGKQENCILLESADIVSKYGERSIGAIDPCLKVIGNKEDFVIRALNLTGQYFLEALQKDLDFCDELILNDNSIKGRLIPQKNNTDEEERLKSRNHFEILRKINFKFIPQNKEFAKYGGLFGAISYDMIDQFEELPQNDKDIIGDPDYELYYVDNLFVMDHKKQEMMIIANALITEQNRDDIYIDCIKKLNKYEENLNAKVPEIEVPEQKFEDIVTDTSKKNYMQKVKKIKQHIKKGDVFQAVLCRTIIADTDLPPYNVYAKLRDINPSPYMFYLRNSEGCLLGASPEMFLRVEGDRDKKVEIRPIAGTKPRGLIKGRIDRDLDSRYELELKLDPKEQAEHTMLIDLARNDVARVCKTGTRYVDEPLIIEKYSHVQHLVSNVSGILKDELDALHAYLASMNMGTLTGAPKIEAMKILRQYESSKRGFYGGAVGYLTPGGDFDSCIVIRSMRFKNNHAYIKVGAGIVHDSDPEKEWEETIKKASACLEALGIDIDYERKR
jgi:anthranilate synthase component 1